MNDVDVNGNGTAASEDRENANASSNNQSFDDWCGWYVLHVYVDGALSFLSCHECVKAYYSFIMFCFVVLLFLYTGAGTMITGH
jgi:hypothetical protein